MINSQAATLAETQKPFKIYYGWLLIPIGFFVYGFGLSPIYYSWGFYGPEMVKEIDISMTQVGSIFGVFQFFYTSCPPLVAVAISYVGLRWTMAGGSLQSLFILVWSFQVLCFLLSACS